MADVDDLFVTHAVTEEDPSGAPEGENEPQEATAEEVAGDVTGLVPLCARHQNGPQLTTATFGYDIAQMEKRPWAEPGAKLSDYFNYGFNEDSWRVYCAMQRDGEESLVANAEDVLQKMRLSVGGPTSDGNMAAAMAPSEMGRYPQPGGPYGGNGGGGAGGRYGGPEEGGYHGGGGGFHGANYKTKLCQRYQEGRCARGSECNYAHGAHELRPAPGGGVAPMGGYAPMGEGQQGMYPTPSGAVPPHQPPQAYQMPYFQPGHGAPPVNFQAPDVPSGDGRYLAPPKRSREETY